MEVPHIMTSPNSDDQHRPDPVDWQRYESEVADVVNLDAARSRRAGTDPDSPADSPADSDPDTGPDTPAGREMVDSIAAQRRPRFTLAGLRDAQRRPVFPTWLHSRPEF